ncbi:MAG TPA: hypothetical protein VJV79_22720 [Polyangiaceae bacterium]|nr:hypothetical protein [Polyangiaceae bacterium]
MTARSADISIAQLLVLQQRSHGSGRLLQNLGDGFLYRKNPFFRRIRDAARARGIGFTLTDPGDYFAFPLVALDTVLKTRKIPYRANYAALSAFERARPGFFTLADLQKNRPLPNYILHESAHALSYHELFGRPRDTHAALSEPSKLVHVVLGEAYAMTAEYFAACAVSGPIHAWFFSINSYRHRTPAKKAVGELVTGLGLPLLVWLVLVAFLENNFFVESLPMKTLERALELYPLGKSPAVSRSDRLRLCHALRALMVMNPEFREDTARLFLTMHGYRRNIRSVLGGEPLDSIAADADLQKRLARLVRALCAG